MIKGIAASPGIEIGKAHVIKPQQVEINTDTIVEENIDMEIKRFNEAVGLSKLQLKQIKEKAEKELGADKAEIFGAHLMILEDPVFLDEIESKIKTESITADNATSQVVKNYVEIFNNLEDEYMKERAADIKDVGERIVKNILGVSTDSFIFSEKVIIIAKDLTPSDTAQMDKDKVLAFATDCPVFRHAALVYPPSMAIPPPSCYPDPTQTRRGKHVRRHHRDL